MVDRLVPQQYSTLQQAVSQANSGDTVKVSQSHTSGQATLAFKNDLTIQGVTSTGTPITKQMVDNGLARPKISTDSNALINASEASRTIIEGLELQADLTSPSASNGHGGNGTISFYPRNTPALDCIIRNSIVRAGPWHVAGIQQNNSANRLTLEDLEITSVPGRPPLGAYSPLGASCFSNFGPKIQNGGAAADNWLVCRRVHAHNCVQWGSSNGINVTKVTDGNGLIAETSNANSSNFQQTFEDCLIHDVGGDAFNFFRWRNAGTTRVINCTAYRMGLTAGLTLPQPDWNECTGCGPNGSNTYSFSGTYVAASQPAYNGSGSSFMAAYDGAGTRYVVSNCLIIRGGTGKSTVFGSLSGGTNPDGTVNGVLEASCNTYAGFSGWGATGADNGANNVVLSEQALQLENIATRDFRPKIGSPLLNSGCATFNGNVADNQDLNCNLWGASGPGRGALAPSGSVVSSCSITSAIPNQPANQPWAINLNLLGDGPFTLNQGAFFDGELTNGVWTGSDAGPVGGSKTMTVTDGSGASCTLTFNVIAGSSGSGDNISHFVG